MVMRHSLIKIYVNSNHEAILDVLVENFCKLSNLNFFFAKCQIKDAVTENVVMWQGSVSQNDRGVGKMSHFFFCHKCDRCDKSVTGKMSHLSHMWKKCDRCDKSVTGQMSQKWLKRDFDPVLWQITGGGVTGHFVTKKGSESHFFHTKITLFSHFFLVTHPPVKNLRNLVTFLSQNPLKMALSHPPVISVN